jgi:hypothetical protein
VYLIVIFQKFKLAEIIGIHKKTGLQRDELFMLLSSCLLSLLGRINLIIILHLFCYPGASCMFKVTFSNCGIGTYGVPVCFTVERETHSQKKQFDIVRTMVGILSLKLCCDGKSAHQVSWCTDAYKFLHF